MDQIFIKVRNRRGKIIDKDIRDTTCKERLEFYNDAVKPELAIIVEKLIKKELRVNE